MESGGWGMSKFGPFLRESLELSVRRQMRTLEQQASPAEVSVLGSLHADAYYSHALKIGLLRGWVVLDFFDTDRDEPLRPQTFAVTGDEWAQLVAASREDDSSYKVGRLRPVTARKGALDTEDAYGSHFSVRLDAGFDDLARRLAIELKRSPLFDPAQELHLALDQLSTGAWQRSHPVVVAVQDRFETSEETARALAPYLSSESCAVLLFVCALLHEELKANDSDLLINPLLQVVEQGQPSEREAAEGHLAALASNLSSAALDRLARQLPRRQSDLYAIGSLIRPFLAVKERAGASIPALVELFPALVERARSSHRVEPGAIVEQVLRIFAAVPDGWATSRGAVEYALRADYKAAEAAKEALLAVMPVAWDDGLVLPQKPAPPQGPSLPQDAYLDARPAREKKPPSPYQNVAAGLALLVILGYLYVNTRGTEANPVLEPILVNRPANQPPPKEAVQALGYQVGGARRKEVAGGSYWEADGQPTEEVAGRWSRYRLPEGQLILSGYGGHRQRSHLPTYAQSDVLWNNGEVVLRAGEPLDAWSKHREAAQEAGIQVQREVVGGQPKILGFAQSFSDEPLDMAPHTSVAEGSTALFSTLDGYRSEPTAWQGALARVPGWKGLRLQDGTPLVMGLAFPRRNRTGAEKARFLIEQGYDLSLRDSAGRSALFVASDKELFELLRKRGLSVEEADFFGRTPIFEASGERLKLLLEAKADVNHQDLQGVTPLMLAPDSDAVARLLMERAKADARDKSGRNALFYQNSMPALEMLLGAGADPDARDGDGRSIEDVKKGEGAKNFRIARNRMRRR